MQKKILEFTNILRKSGIRAASIIPEPSTDLLVIAGLVELSGHR